MCKAIIHDQLTEQLFIPFPKISFVFLLTNGCVHPLPLQSPPSFLSFLKNWITWGTILQEHPVMPQISHRKSHTKTEVTWILLQDKCWSKMGFLYMISSGRLRCDSYDILLDWMKNMQSFHLRLILNLFYHNRLMGRQSLEMECTHTFPSMIPSRMKKTKKQKPSMLESVI